MFAYLHPPGPDRAFGVAFTDRQGGVSAGAFGPLNLGRTDADDIAAVRENFVRVRKMLGVRRIVTVAQVHGNDVAVFDRQALDQWGPEQHLGSGATAIPLTRADAMITNERDVALCIRVADCLPIMLADEQAGVIGAAHAGRVGLAAGVLGKTVAAMRDLGARDIHTLVGPHICGACYEVPDQMRAEVSAVLAGAYAETSWGAPALDLGAAAVRQLGELGCSVERHDPCTRTDGNLHSFRRDGAGAGRLGGFIWLPAADSPAAS